MSAAPRYAIYLIPGSASPLWRLGSAWLGYDALTGEDVSRPALDSIPPGALSAMTEDPRRYGFHMTLKAPFRLAEGQDERALGLAFRAFADRHSPLASGPLVLEMRCRKDGWGFVCLAPARPVRALVAIERAAVESFEAFRAPLTEAEVARRRPEQLSERQRALLDRYGYPFVLDEFRPHFSLTGLVADPAAAMSAIAAWLKREAVALENAGLAPALFRQDTSDRRFRVVETILP